MWAQAISAALGVWLMAAPAVLGYGGTAAATNDRIIGPLAASFAIVALWEATRALRWVNLPLGVWMLIAPWVLGSGTAATLNSLAVGVLLTALSFVRGRLQRRFGGGWSMLWKSDREVLDAT